MLGDLIEIDFDTLPDGSPGFLFAEITPEFNYTAQGIIFASPEPSLVLLGGPTDFGLCACPENTSDPLLRWIEAELVDSAWAVGATFPGHSTLSFFNDENVLIAEEVFFGGGTNFVGIVSDEPIALAVVDKGGNMSIVSNFFFTPIPEPGTLILFGFGALVCLRRRKRK